LHYSLFFDYFECKITLLNFKSINRVKDILPKDSTSSIVEQRSKVVMLLAEGKTQVQIASLLKVSPQLIHDDIKAIFNTTDFYPVQPVQPVHFSIFSS
jgi:DNA-binding NarL/FixJ family response regulator